MKMRTRQTMQLWWLVALLCGTVQVASAQPDIATSNPTFEAIDGKTQQTVLRIEAEANRTADGVEVHCNLQRDAKTNRTAWTTQLRNTGKVQRWLTLRWSAEFKTTAPFHYWNGHDEPRPSALLAKNPYPAGKGSTMPLQAAYDDKRGLALALAPLELYSDLKQSFQVDANSNGQSGRLVLEIPLVLDAGHSDTFQTELYSFIPRYNYLDAVQLYHEAHPDDFQPRPNIDPRALGGGAIYEVWNADEPEMARRFLGDWEWAYTPFKRAGDLYGRPELWDYQPPFPIRADLPNEAMGLLTQPEFQKQRKERFKRGERANTAMMFYTPAFIWTERSLAEQKYASSIIRNPDGTPRLVDSKWVTYHDNEIGVYPWGNDYAAQSQRDARQLVDELDIAGFAYDVLGGSERHRGAGLENSPRRAFDEHGVYVDMCVGIAKMMDFTRSLKKNGQPMAIVANPPGDTARQFLTGRSDSNILEFLPYEHMNWVKAIRLTSGQKPLRWWSTWALGNSIQWERMSPEQLKQAYRGARDQVLLASFAYGVVPTPRLVTGVPKLAHWIKTLRRLAIAGWQAVPAVRVSNSLPPETLWPARYGRGVGSYITLGNAARTPYRGWVRIDNAYLGNDNYLFARHDGQPLLQHCSGHFTEIEVDIPAHEPLVLQAIAAVPASQTGGAIVSWQDDGLRGSLKVEGVVPPRRPVFWEGNSLGHMFQPERELPLPRSVIAPWPCENRTTPKPLTPGVWEFQSLTFSTPLAELREFPFFGEKATATIVLPQQPAPEEEWAAMRLQEYFRFLGRNGVTPARMIDLSIVRGVEKPAGSNGATIFIGTAAPATKNPPVSRLGNSLFVRGDSPAQTRAALLKLLDALDGKYPYIGKIEAAWQRDPLALLQKAGLDGGVLD